MTASSRATGCFDRHVDASVGRTRAAKLVGVSTYGPLEKRHHLPDVDQVYLECPAVVGFHHSLLHLHHHPWSLTQLDWGPKSWIEALIDKWIDETRVRHVSTAD